MNIQNRLAKLRLKMASEHLDAIFITSFPHRFYFAGFTGDSGYLLILPDRQYLLTDARFTLQAKNESADFEVVDYEGKLFGKMKEYINSAQAKRLGIEDASMSVAFYQKLKEALPEMEAVPFSEVLTSLRRIKEPEELRRIAAAEEIGDRAFSYTIERMKIGMTEREVAALLEGCMRTLGAEKVSFDTIVASGARGALPHGVASEKKLEVGDAVVMDFGCIYEGYCSDMTRTVVMGRASDKLKAAYKSVLSAGELAIQGARAEMSAKDLDAIARNRLEKDGWGDYFTHSLGHGVGIDIHEAPTASPRSSDILESGMTVTVEPGIYLPGEFGIRIEDLIAFDGDKVRNFTHSRKELLIIS